MNICSGPTFKITLYLLEIRELCIAGFNIKVLNNFTNPLLLQKFYQPASVTRNTKVSQTIVFEGGLPFMYQLRLYALFSAICNFVTS